MKVDETNKIIYYLHSAKSAKENRMATLGIIAGMPCSGKSTLGRALERKTRIHYCDSDDLRMAAFGALTHAQYEERWKNPDRAQKLTAQDMGLSYELLHFAMRLSLDAGRSILVSATYSRLASQEIAKRIAKLFEAQLRLVLCDLGSPTQEEAERRMKRDDGQDVVLGTRTWEDYKRNEIRYISPATTNIFAPDEVLVVDTSQPLETYLDRAAEFILS